jgi:hypothetical protein
MDIAVLAQVLSSLATFVVAAGILYQGREARRARDDEDRQGERYETAWTINPLLLEGRAGIRTTRATRTRCRR